MAYKTKQNVETNLKDYSAIVVKHERKSGMASWSPARVRLPPASLRSKTIGADRIAASVSLGPQHDGRSRDFRDAARITDVGGNVRRHTHCS